MEDWKIRRYRDRIFSSREDGRDVLCKLDNNIVRDYGELCAINFGARSKNIIEKLKNIYSIIFFINERIFTLFFL